MGVGFGCRSHGLRRQEPIWGRRGGETRKYGEKRIKLSLGNLILIQEDFEYSF